ncbi:MAG: hypothetical protein KM296_00050 [Brockia lithotrophica]|nr:hypothetical protein [Brockia lithotrophica]
MAIFVETKAHEEEKAAEILRGLEIIAHQRPEDPDLRDKWRKWSEEVSEPAILSIMNSLGYEIYKNPEKEYKKTAIDYILSPHNVLVDLKTVFTPFFKAEELFNIPILNTVTFNVSDFKEYEKKYFQQNIPLFILFFVYFQKGMSYKKITLETGRLHVFFVEFSEIVKKKHVFPVHAYKNRVGKTGNATSSFVVNTEILERKDILFIDFADEKELEETISAYLSPEGIPV